MSIKDFFGMFKKENPEKEFLQELQRDAILGKCERCKEIYECLELKIDNEKFILCPYCLEQVKKHGKIIPEVVRYVKNRVCNKCSKFIAPHEYFYYSPDWEFIEKSLGYFCGECCRVIDSVNKQKDIKTIWIATKCYEHPIYVDEETK
jgi:hypothetical protein